MRCWDGEISFGDATESTCVTHGPLMSSVVPSPSGEYASVTTPRRSAYDLMLRGSGDIPTCSWTWFTVGMTVAVCRMHSKELWQKLDTPMALAFLAL